MDAAEIFRSTEVPPRSLHSWRYTPWRKVHPDGDERSIPDEVDTPRLDVQMADGSSCGFGFGDVESGEDGPDDIAFRFVKALAVPVQRLSIPDGTILEQPLSIHIRAAGHVACSRIEVMVGRNCEVEIQWTLSGEPGWLAVERMGSIGQGSIYSEAFEQRLSIESRLLRVEDWNLERDASMTTSTLVLGSAMSRSDLRAHLSTGSSFNQSSAVHGYRESRHDHHFEIDHPVGMNQSSLTLHNACDDSSSSSSTGILRIAEGADGSDAGQVFKSILLSPQAKADAIPELEVLADDVSAAHGAACAPIDEQQLFYMMSRGLMPEEARSIMTEGFLMAAFNNCRSRGLVDWMRGRLSIHLECPLVE